MPAIETMPIDEAEELLGELAEEKAWDEVRKFQSKTARKIWPRGATLVCRRCRRVQTATTIELAGYLGRDWPVCCGLMMHIDDPEGGGDGD